MRALVFERNLPRYAASRAAAAIAGSGRGVRVGPLRIGEIDPPELPRVGWHRLRPRLAGICGSDLATIDARSSRYFEPIVSFPFVPGHEVVADAEGGELDGRRVVLEPVLGCVVRGIHPLCQACAAGRIGACERIAFGHLSPGLQTGYCADTGGGWSTELVADESQLHLVPDDLSDEAAVMVEPAACAVHAALAPWSPGGGGRGRAGGGDRVVVLGAGTVGLCVIAALRHFVLPASVLAVAKYPEQRRLAAELGADTVAEPGESKRAARRMTGSLALSTQRPERPGAVDRLTGGADVVFDCVGSEDSLAESVAVVRAGGTVMLVGMPGVTRVDLAPLWQREIVLRGAYAYGTEVVPGSSGHGGRGEAGLERRTFDLAFELVRAARLERLVSAYYPLESYEEAIAHAAGAGRRGAVKVVFDLRRKTPQWRQVRAAEPAAGVARGGGR